FLAAQRAAQLPLAEDCRQPWLPRSCEGCAARAVPGPDEQPQAPSPRRRREATAAPARFCRECRDRAAAVAHVPHHQRRPYFIVKAHPRQGPALLPVCAGRRRVLASLVAPLAEMRIRRRNVPDLASQGRCTALGPPSRWGVLAGAPFQSMTS